VYWYCSSHGCTRQGDFCHQPSRLVTSVIRTSQRSGVQNRCSAAGRADRAAADGRRHAADDGPRPTAALLGPGALLTGHCGRAAPGSGPAQPVVAVPSPAGRRPPPHRHRCRRARHRRPGGSSAGGRRLLGGRLGSTVSSTGGAVGSTGVGVGEGSAVATAAAGARVRPAGRPGGRRRTGSGTRGPAGRPARRRCRPSRSGWRSRRR
jgi:hypothetical protein